MEEQSAQRRGEGYDLGVLVVHGIGDQKQGATLVQWSDALTLWLSDWTAEDRRSSLHQTTAKPRKVSVTRAALTPIDGTPANVTMKVLFPEPETNDQQWLIAEGWWAGAFQPPKFSELWSWSFSSVPATSAMHANAIIGSALSRYRLAEGSSRVFEAVRIVVLVSLLSVLVLLSPAILAVMTLLLIAGLIAQALPFTGLQAVVKKAQLIAVGTIGDSQRLIESPTQAGAIKAPVVDGLAWLRAQGCRRVVILAHSQGAAVSYKALVDLSDGLHGSTFDPIDSFITIGSGLPKVHALEHITRANAGRQLRAASFAIPVLAVTTALCFWYLRQRGEFAGLIGMGVIAAVTGLIQLRLWRQRVRGETADAITADGHTTPVLAPDGAAEARVAGPVRWWRSLTKPIQVGPAQIPAGPVLGAAVAAVVWAWAAPFGGVALAAAGSTTLVLTSIAVIAVGRIPPIPSDLSGAAHRWVDLYATKDPVPAGSTRSAVEGRPESWPVSNLGSTTKDHTYYSFNADECLTYVGVELLEVAGVPVHGEAIRTANANYGFERKWRVGWRAFMTYGLTLASVLFGWSMWRRPVDDIQRIYEEQASDTSFLADYLPDLVPYKISPTTAQVVATIGYVAFGFVLIKIGQALWSSWDRKEAAREIGPVVYSETEIPPQFGVMIAFLVFALMIGAAPVWLLSRTQELDLASRSTAVVLVLVIAVPYLFGTYLPRILIVTGIKAWVISRDRARGDALVGLGDYHLSRGDTTEAVESFRRAAATARYQGIESPAAMGGLARALDRLTDDAAATARVQLEHQARAEADECFAAATRLIKSVPIDTFVAYANFLAASVGDRQRARRVLATAGPVARRRRLDVYSARFLQARVAHFQDAADPRLAGDTASKAERLIEARWLTFGPDEKLAVAYAVLVALGPANDRSAHWRGIIDELLDAGFRAPNMDLRVSLMKLPGGWSDQSAEMVELAAQIQQRSTPPAAPLTVRSSRKNPRVVSS